MVRTESQSRPPKPQRAPSNNSPKHSSLTFFVFEADDERSSSEPRGWAKTKDSETALHSMQVKTLVLQAGKSY